MAAEAVLQVPCGSIGRHVLRRTVCAVCACSALPFDRVDDLMIICDELLERATGRQEFAFFVTDRGVRVELPALDPGAIVTTLASELTREGGTLSVFVASARPSRGRRVAGPGPDGCDMGPDAGGSGRGPAAA